ncbi:hypothetical protein D1872_270190 [compost metagenome]
MRPFNGLRRIFSPGPSNASISLLNISRPSSTYSSSISPGFQVAASKVPIGTCVASSPLSMRIPEGPSAVQAIGIPYCSKPSLTPPKAEAVPDVTNGLLIPSPRTIAASSSSLSCATNSSMRTLPSWTSRRRKPRSPVCSHVAGSLARTRSSNETVLMGTSS